MRYKVAAGMRGVMIYSRIAYLLALLGAGVVVIAVSPEFALVLAPVFALLTALVLGMFPGEDLLERIRTRRCPQPRRRPTNATPRRRTLPVRRVGRAVAFALAVRPPPASLALR
jgi:hypothetical protein